MAKYNSKNDIHLSVVVDLYFNKKMSLPDVSNETGISKSTVRQLLIRYGYKLRDSKIASRMNSYKVGLVHKGVKRNFTEEHKKNIGLAKKLNYESTSLKPSGYIEITNGENKGRRAHIVVMEAFIGRKLKSNEIVHHIDHDKTNNCINNLALMTSSAHTKLHRFEEKLLKLGEKDG